MNRSKTILLNLLPVMGSRTVTGKLQPVLKPQLAPAGPEKHGHQGFHVKEKAAGDSGKVIKILQTPVLLKDILQ